MEIAPDVMSTTLSQLSLYVHFPFCVRRCRYCDFYSEPAGRDMIHPFINALGREWCLVRDALAASDFEVPTLYCGGGTPSILEPTQWQQFCDTVLSELPLHADAEWTLECNPESYSTDKALMWQASGVNRLSLGVQSLDNRLLRLMGRPHSARQALAVLADPVLAQFRSVGVDIIFGLPGQTIASLRETLDMLLSMDVVRHLSAYELTVNEHTAFGRHRNCLGLPGEDLTVDMMALVQETAAAHGLEQYEVSNYAYRGHHSRHNRAYWEHAPYVGLGPSAHSFDSKRRWANVASVAEYVRRLGHDELPREFTEEITARQRAQELLMLGLRTSDGVDEERFARETGETFADPRRRPILEALVAQRRLAHCPPRWKPTREGLRVADAMARALT